MCFSMLEYFYMFILDQVGCLIFVTFPHSSCRCRKLPKALKEWQAFNDLKKKIDDFNETCPVLERILDPAMKERHWKRIEEVTGWKFEVESDGFQLRHVMEAPLLKNLEDIEVCVCVCVRACVRACMHTCMHVSVHACVCV